MIVHIISISYTKGFIPMDSKGFDQEGYDTEGFGRNGYNKNGLDRNGRLNPE